MFTSVRIQNFRQFRDLKLEGLGQINLITGANDTGKTSLLEALFLLDGPLDPSRTVVVANFRGIDRLSPQSSELWGWLYRDRDTTHVIELSGKDNEGRCSGFKATVSRGSLIPAVRNGDPGVPSRSIPYVTQTEPLPALTYNPLEAEEKRQVDLRWTSQGLALEPDLRPPGSQGFFLPDGHRAGKSEAVRFSRLEAIGRESEVVDALKIVEPRLRRLTVLDLGEGSSLYADLGQVPIVPLSLLGEGFGKLLTILSAILLRETEIFLIDEIGNGFHYSILVSIWKAIIDTATQQSVQVFATTHSWECIEAAVKASEDHVAKLALFRLERHKNDIRVVDIAGSRLRSAVDLEFELR